MTEQRFLACDLCGKRDFILEGQKFPKDWLIVKLEVRRSPLLADAIIYESKHFCKSECLKKYLKDIMKKFD